MRFIPETIEALDEMADGADGEDLRGSLQRVADRAQAIATDLVGISVTVVDRGLTFTLVATHDDLAALDAVQYLDSGPCVDVVGTGRGTASGDRGLLDEDAWQLMGLAAAALGVRSTLTFPVLLDGETVASVNLYGATAHAFDGHHHELADAVGGWAAGAVSNADLSFQTAEMARRTPSRIRDQALVDRAVGVLAVRADLRPDDARAVLQEAAARSGVTVEHLARVVLRLPGD